MNAPTDDNPYAPPAAWDIPPAPPEVAFIQNDHLVVPAGWQSPPVCILTGKTVDLRPHRKTFFWASPVRMLAILGVGIFLFVRNPSTEFANAMIMLLSITYSFIRKDFIDFYINKSNEKIYKIKQAITQISMGVMFIFCFEFNKYLYGVFIFASGLGILAFLQLWSFRIANARWKRLWLGGVPHEVMKTIVRMDEERAASQETPFPAPRLNFKS